MTGSGCYGGGGVAGCPLIKTTNQRRRGDWDLPISFGQGKLL